MRQCRTGGELPVYYTARYDSPVGWLTLCGSGEALAGLWLEGQKYFGGSIAGEMEPGEDLPVFDRVRSWLDQYFAGKQPPVDTLPLSPAGGEFRQAVWNILREIPYGQVITYGAIARRIAAQQGRTTLPAQAVGGAVAHNPISILIPCHRVVGTSGSLTGYAGGIEKKIWLLEHEGVEVSRFFVPKGREGD